MVLCTLINKENIKDASNFYNKRWLKKHKYSIEEKVDTYTNKYVYSTSSSPFFFKTLYKENNYIRTDCKNGVKVFTNKINSSIKYIEEVYLINYLDGGWDRGVYDNIIKKYTTSTKHYANRQVFVNIIKTKDYLKMFKEIMALQNKEKLAIIFYDFSIDNFKHFVDRKVEENILCKKTTFKKTDIDDIDLSFMKYKNVEGIGDNKNYQVDFIKKGLSYNRFGFFIGTGSGKSYITYGIVGNLFKDKKIDLCMILTSSVGVENLKKQAFKLTNLFTEDEILVVDKNNRGIFSSAQEINKKKLIILSYDTLKLVLEYFKDSNILIKLFSSKNVCLIYDEVHLAGNSQSQRGKAILQLGDMAEFLYIFTATPGDKPIYYYTYCYLLDKEGLLENRNYFSFLREYCIEINLDRIRQQRFYVWNKSKLSELNNKMSNYVVNYSTKDLIFIPQDLTEYKYLELTEDEEDTYNKVLDEIEENKTYSILKVLQTLDTEAKTKMDAIDEMLDKDKKTIIWSTHPFVLNTIKERLEKRGLKCLIVNGETKTKERQSQFDLFNIDNEYKILLASPLVVNSSIDLFYGGCYTQIYYDLPLKSSEYIQSKNRILRIGQTKDVNTYILLYKGTLDTIRLKLVENKVKFNKVFGKNIDFEYIKKLIK